MFKAHPNVRGGYSRRGKAALRGRGAFEVGSCGVSTSPKLARSRLGVERQDERMTVSTKPSQNAPARSRWFRQMPKPHEVHERGWSLECSDPSAYRVLGRTRDRGGKFVGGVMQGAREACREPAAPASGECPRPRKRQPVALGHHAASCRCPPPVEAPSSRRHRFKAGPTAITLQCSDRRWRSGSVSRTRTLNHAAFRVPTA